jgi:enoyl-CoA hydratase/carnithine racemase
MAEIEVARTGRIATITINRPEKKNSINLSMWSDLQQALWETAFDEEVRVLVVQGAGTDFCAGADLSQAGDLDNDKQVLVMLAIGEVATFLHRFPKPTIAKVRGVAVGAGCNLALACDLVAADSTCRFSEIFSQRGLSIDFGGSWLLPRRVGLHKAKEVAFFGKILEADDVLELGLANRVVEPEALDGVVSGWCEELEKLPPIALLQTKLMLNNSMASSIEQAVGVEAMAQTVNASSPATADLLAQFKQRPR